MEASEFRDWRHRLGLTQLAVADRIGVSTRAVKHWEGGTRPIDDRTAELCALIEAEALRLRPVRPEPPRRRRYPARSSILVGDALAILPTLPAKTFQTVITSPPYFGV